VRVGHEPAHGGIRPVSLSEHMLDDRSSLTPATSSQPSTDAVRTRVATLLTAAATGDGLATDELFPIVYDELHRLASGLMAKERGKGPYTLQATALVNEAYVRLMGPGDHGWKSRGQFFGAAAKAMRHILIDRARRARTAKEKGGPELHESMVPTFDSRTTPESAADELVSLDGALESLRARDDRQHEVVMLKYFAGLTFEQIAETLDLAPSTVKADWSYARAWLLREMSRGDSRG
jgi:RNA polymerase sigma factor (TIGR02999 family)